LNTAAAVKYLPLPFSKLKHVGQFARIFDVLSGRNHHVCGLIHGLSSFIKASMRHAHHC